MRKRIWIIGLTAGMLLLAVMMVNFAGCAKTENALLSEFRDMTQEAPTPQGLEEAVSFIDKHIGDVSEEGASRLVLAYEDFLLRYVEAGGETPVDYDALRVSYGEYVSPELRELYAIKALEASEPSTQDAQILPSYPDLLDRALSAENLLQEHRSEDVLRANTLEYYKDYLFLLLAGSDRSPMFDYDSGSFSPEAREAYEDFIITHPDTILAGTLTEYFDYLNNAGFHIDYADPVENKVFYDTCDYLIEKALESL